MSAAFRIEICREMNNVVAPELRYTPFHEQKVSCNCLHKPAGISGLLHLGFISCVGNRGKALTVFHKASGASGQLPRAFDGLKNSI